MEERVPDHLMETGESFEQKYQPVLDFEGWRVAMLRHMPETDYKQLSKMERHLQTNEVFILSEGSAHLIIGENGKSPGKMFIFPMRKNVAYNLKKEVWHHVLMSEDAHIILFERTDTTVENTDYYKLTQEEIKFVNNNLL